MTENQEFQKLDALLKAGKWQDADLETWNLILKLTKRQQKGWLRIEDVKNFPRQKLRKMDQLWVKYSNGKFGFSVQKQIWLDLGGKLDGEPDFDTYKKLGDRVDWRQNGEWLGYYSYIFSTNAPSGHLPALWVRGDAVDVVMVCVVSLGGLVWFFGWVLALLGMFWGFNGGVLVWFGSVVVLSLVWFSWWVVGGLVGFACGWGGFGGVVVGDPGWGGLRRRRRVVSFLFSRL